MKETKPKATTMVEVSLILTAIAPTAEANQRPVNCYKDKHRKEKHRKTHEYAEKISLLSPREKKRQTHVLPPSKPQEMGEREWKKKLWILENLKRKKRGIK